MGLSGGVEVGSGQVQVSGHWQAQGPSMLSAWASCPALPESSQKRPVQATQGLGSELGLPSGQQSCPQGPGHGTLEFWRTPGPLVAPATPTVGPV